MNTIEALTEVVVSLEKRIKKLEDDKKNIISLDKRIDVLEARVDEVIDWEPTWDEL